MKPSFVRRRKKWRAVLVVPGHLSALAPHLRQKNFHPIALPAGPLDDKQKELWLPGRTLITNRPEELAPDQQLASRQLVEHLLAALKPVERLAIDLLYLQGRSVEEIRKITGWSAALIKVRAFRARQKMKQQLTKISAKEKQ